jgi:hypothetical protein
MLLPHGDQIRRRSGKQMAREAQAPKLTLMLNREPTDVSFRPRAHEIYLGRSGTPGNAARDWLQAEIGWRARAGLAKAPSA